ncbi:thioredoxin family protein [gut metagenome]|uniref:Thioredoxin family protein n=1 Tax=gut metagenome TaxID=749906 RepID=J9GQI2_9ZZZZ
MKHLFFNVLASAALFTACQTTPQRTLLQGEIMGVETDTLFVKYQSLVISDRPSNTDTIVMQNGKFSFVIPNDTFPTEVWLYAKPRGGNASIARGMQLFAIPGETVTLSGDFPFCTQKGHALHQAWNETQVLFRPYLQQMDSIGKHLTELQNQQAPREEVMALFNKQFRPVRERYREAKTQYVATHLDQSISLIFLYELGPDATRQYLHQLAPEVREGQLATLYQLLNERLERLQTKEEAKKLIEVGKPAPDFTLTDINGAPFSLSSLRGKYVVLDFWGSWCGWCIKGMPDMKKYYDKYRQHLEIVGIDCNDTEQKWKEAVKKYELPWLHVRNDEEKDVTLQYAVEGYPTKILIAPDGRIAKVVVGEDPAFYKYIDSLFK